MSKAFTTNDEGVPEPPSRPKVKLQPGEVRYVTAEGRAELQAELDRLQAERSAAARAPELERRARLAELDAKLAPLAELLQLLTIAPPVPPEVARVVIGAWVTVEDEDGERAVWRLVGPDEADPARQRVSVQSPFGRALLGREVGDAVTFERPRGQTELTILEIAAAAPR